jgi:SAM-dependent methyltransferase
MGTLYQRLKALLPRSVRDLLSAVNQRWFARRTLRAKYGDWFEVYWREKFRSMSDEEWASAYNDAWKHHPNDCVSVDDAMMFLHELSEPGSVLDVGCGSGGLAIRLARAGHRVAGVDVSDVALDIAREAARSAGVTIEWRRAFAERLPFPDQSFDYVVSAHTIEHVRDLPQVAAEFRRVARKKILVLTPRQSYKKYMDNYHTQFFEHEHTLPDAFGLAEFRCREVDAGAEGAEFRGKAWFYSGVIPQAPDR